MILEGRHEADLLLVAAREALDLLRQVELETIDQLRPVGPIRTPAQVAEVLERLGAGQVAVEGEFAGQVAHPPGDGESVAVGVEPQHLGPSRCRTDEIEQQTGRRRLARAVRPEETEDLARPDLEVDPDDPAGLAVVLGQLLCADDGVHPGLRQVLLS